MALDWLMFCATLTPAYWSRMSMAVTPELPANAWLPPLRKWLPILVLAVVAVAAYGLGLQTYLSLETVAEHRAQLKAFVTEHLIASIAVFMVVYVVVVASSLPGAAVMTIAGGFLFGWWVGAAAAMVAATVGAVIVFEVVKTSLGAVLVERAGPFIRKFSSGFAADAFSYLLFLRLVPAFPFFAVNAVAGLCNVRFKTFLAATAIGIIPGSIAFAWLGIGLDSIIDAHAENYRRCIASAAANCTYDLELSALVTNEILIAFAGLGVIALIPIAVKYARRQGRH